LSGIVDECGSWDGHFCPDERALVKQQYLLLSLKSKRNILQIYTLYVNNPRGSNHPYLCAFVFTA
jgi:hypothetical protein